MKQEEIYHWMTQKGYDRKASKDIAPIIEQFISEHQPTTPQLSAGYAPTIDETSPIPPSDSGKPTQPTPTPEISAEEYVDSLVDSYYNEISVLDRECSIQCAIIDQQNTITALELAGVDATYYKNALEYLKGR